MAEKARLFDDDKIRVDKVERGKSSGIYFDENEDAEGTE